MATPDLIDCGFIVQFDCGGGNCHFCQVASARSRSKLTSPSRLDMGTVPLHDLRLTMKSLVLVTILLGAGTAAAAQPSPPSSASQSTQDAFSPAKSIGMFAYPKNGQNADQQLKDESECYGSAKQQSGVDPQAPPPPAKTAEQKAAEQQAAAANAPQAKGGRVKGVARGAAAGAGLGAIAGDAGTGAAVGAAAGTMKDASKQRQAKAASQKQAAVNTAALDTFKRASACMDACGYSVK